MEYSLVVVVVAVAVACMALLVYCVEMDWRTECCCCAKMLTECRRFVKALSNRSTNCLSNSNWLA